MNTNTILMIDDDMDDRELMDTAIKAMGGHHAIVQADNGEEGIRKLTELVESGHPPCLIILDLNMPRKNGWETFSELKATEKFSEIPVVIFSTSASFLDRQYFESRKTDYLVKPIDFRHLKDIAGKLIQKCEDRKSR